MGLSEYNDLDWFYEKVEKSQIKMPTEFQENAYLLYVKNNVEAGLTIESARVKAFSKAVML